MTITIEQLQQIIPNAGSRVGVFHQPLVDAMAEFDISTPARQAAFLAQVAHESGSLRYVREIASGGAYEGRVDLGNTEPGDGIRYKGRGLIQITGRANYQVCGDSLGLPLLEHPELLEQPENAARSAGWFWAWKRLNDLADAGDFVRITKRINGGLNGYDDRANFWERAKQVLGA